MFNKKVCGRCGKSLKQSYDFCPFCGNMLEKKDEDFGMLGKSDLIDENVLNGFQIPSGFNNILNSLLRNLDKQFKDADKKQPQNLPGQGISISISTNMGAAPQTFNFNPSEKEKKKKKSEDLKKMFFNNLNSEKLKKFSKLPRTEPKTNIRRLSNKVIYEVNLPGVKSVKDISIMPLEKSMELRAISDKKAYTKSIPINLPISNYKLSKGKFVLELDEE